MDSRVEIPVEVLREAAQVLLEHLDAVGGPVIALEEDYYWAISPEQRTDVYVEPTEFTVGQISECLENLGRVIDDPALRTSYGLVWLADLLRAAGEAVVR